MTLEEKKARFRKRHGLADDYPVFTPEEAEANRQAQQMSSVGAAFEAAKDEAVPGLFGLAGLKGAIQTIGKIPLPGIPGKVAKGIGIFGTAIGSAIAGHKVQDKVLEAVRDEDTNQADKLLSQELRKEHPIAFTTGEVVGGSLGGGIGPSTQNLKGLGELVRTGAGLRGKANKELVSHTLQEAGVGAGVGMALEGARQYSEGDFKPGAMITTGIGGALFTKPVLHGKKLIGTPTVPQSEAQIREQTSDVEFANVTQPKVNPDAQFADETIQPTIEQTTAQEVVFLNDPSLSPVQRAARIDDYQKMFMSKKAGDDAAKKPGKNPAKESSKKDASDQLNKKASAKPEGLDDPQIDEALAKKFGDEVKIGVKRAVANISDEKLSNIERMAQGGAARQYADEINQTPAELRTKLEAEITKNLGPDSWLTVKNLMAQRNTSIRLAVDELVDQAGRTVYGFTPRNSRTIVLSPAMLEETPFHEVAHVWASDMIGSVSRDGQPTADSNAMKGWLKELYDVDESSTVKSKDDALEQFAKETGRQLADRMLKLPKGKFDKMRRWFSDIQRGRRMATGKSRNRNDILDFMAQRIEIDRNPLADTDLMAREGQSLASFVDSAKVFDTQLGDPSESHKSTTTIDGVKYESVANAYAVPTEIAKLFNVPDMPKGFAKKYANELNKLKASIMEGNEYTPSLDYVQSFSLAEVDDYPAAYKSMMQGLQKRNTGALKQIFKMFEDDPIDITLETSQPDMYRGLYDETEIKINIPTIDDNFDMVLAQQLVKRHLRDNQDVLKDLTGVWQRLTFGDTWFQGYEPELVTRFLKFASQHDMPEEFAAVVARYSEDLGVDGVQLSYRGQSESMRNNFAKYHDKMLNQGNSLHFAMKNLPDDVRKAFAQTMLNKSSMWDDADTFLADFDSMINTFGVSGSHARNRFNRLSRSPRHVIDGLVSKESFVALDGFNRLWPRVDAAPHVSPLDRGGKFLEDLWSKDVVPFEQSKFTTMPALDAITQLSEEAINIKGLKNIFERVTTPPIPPRRVDYHRSTKTAKDSSTIDIANMLKNEPLNATPIDFEGQMSRKKTLDAERAKRYATLPDFNAREPKTWKPFQMALRGVRPVVDRIREIGLTPAAKKLASLVADSFNATLKDETLLNGQYLEKLMLIHSEVKMSPAELDDLGDFQLQRWHKKLGLREKYDPELFQRYTENPRMRYYDRAIQNIMRDTRQYQNDIGMMVESHRDGKPVLSPGKYTQEYTPEIITQEVRTVMMKRETASPEYNKLKQEAVDYWTGLAKRFDEKLGSDDLDTTLSIGEDGTPLKDGGENDADKLRIKFEQLFDKLALSFQGKEKKLGSHKFKALRVATGKYGLPPHWVERNALQRLTRYVVRFSKDAAYFKNVEAKPEVRKVLGIPDQAGNYSDLDIEGLEKGGPFNLKNVIDGKIVDTNKKGFSKDTQASHEVLDDFMQGFVGYYEGWDIWTRTFNRMVTSSWLGFGAGMRDLLSSYMFALPYMRTQDLPILATHLVGWSNAWVKSFEMGVNKTSLNNLEWRQSGASEVTDQVNKVADVLLKVGGRNTLEQVTRTLQFAFGRQLTLQALRSHNKATIGIPDWTADRLLKAVDQQMGGGANFQGKRKSLYDYIGQPKHKIPDEILDQAAAAWVEINQGTYDVRGLPKFTQRGVPSMFTSLARWSIEKSDRMVKDVLLPLTTQNDPLPLIKATFGAVLGGQAIVYLSEEIANKIQSDPKLIEAIQMENPKEAAQAVMSSVAFAGYFGIQSSIVHDLVRASRYGVLEGIPGGLTFPAANAAFTIAKDFFHVVSSGEAAGDNWWDTWMTFVHNTFNGLNQTMRYASQHIMLSDEMSDFNARAQLRKFTRLEEGEVQPGVPSGMSNPYTWPARRAFQRSNTMAEAQRLLPAALNEAAEKAIRQHPNNPVEQNKHFQNNYRQLYNLDWHVTPALPDKRDPVSHLKRMRYLGLEGPKEVNRGKGDLTKILGKKITGGMQRGTIISQKEAKRLMEAEKAAFNLKEPKRNLVLRAVANKGRAY